MKNVIVAAVFMATSLALGNAVAQEKQNLSPAQQAEGRLMLQTARNLIQLGEARSDPLALVTAANLIAGVPGRVLADGQAGEGGADKATNFDVESVLKKAEDLAQGDQFITKAAADIRAAASADAKAMCYWEYYCFYNSWCEYSYTCW